MNVRCFGVAGNSVVRRMNEVTQCWVRLVYTWMGDRFPAGIPSRYVNSQASDQQLSNKRCVVNVNGLTHIHQKHVS